MVHGCCITATPSMTLPTDLPPLLVGGLPILMGERESTLSPLPPPVLFGGARCEGLCEAALHIGHRPGNGSPTPRCGCGWGSALGVSKEEAGCPYPLEWSMEMTKGGAPWLATRVPTRLNQGSARVEELLRALFDLVGGGKDEGAG